MGDVHDVGGELGDGLGDLALRPRPPRLDVVQQVVDQGGEVRLQQVEQRLEEESQVRWDFVTLAVVQQDRLNSCSLAPRNSQLLHLRKMIQVPQKESQIKEDL